MVHWHVCISAAFENVGNLLSNADSTMKVEEAKVSQTFAFYWSVYMPKHLYKPVSIVKISSQVTSDGVLRGL